MRSFKRIIKHLLSGKWAIQRAFPSTSLQAIETAIQTSEKQHRGEIRFAVEAALDTAALFRNQPPRSRAIDVFSRLRIWDTEENNGVLIYLLLADRNVEIVADRGIHQKVGDGSWETICRDMETLFRAGQFEQGVLIGISAISDLLAQHFPANTTQADELPNSAIIL